MVRKSKAKSKAKANPKPVDPMKSLSTQLRKKGIAMVLEESKDPQTGATSYTFQSVKPGAMSNMQVAYKLYYAGEVAKYSTTRQRAMSKALAVAKAKEEQALKEKNVMAMETVREEREESEATTITTTTTTSTTGTSESGSGIFSGSET